MADILLLYNLTPTAAEPWLAAGHNVTSVDLQHPPGTRREGHYTTVGADVPAWINGNYGGWHFALSFTPCTDLAVSGARWFARKREANPQFQQEAVDLARVVEQLNCPSITENPVSMLWTLWKPCTGYVHPWQFTEYCADDNYTKKTGLLCLNGARMPAPAVDESLGPPDDRIHKAAPGPDRANFRSATPRGLSLAIYLANKGLV